MRTLEDFCMSRDEDNLFLRFWKTFAGSLAGQSQTLLAVGIRDLHIHKSPFSATCFSQVPSGAGIYRTSVKLPILYSVQLIKEPVITCQ